MINKWRHACVASKDELLRVKCRITCTIKLGLYRLCSPSFEHPAPSPPACCPPPALGRTALFLFTPHGYFRQNS